MDFETSIVDFIKSIVFDLNLPEDVSLQLLEYAQHSECGMAFEDLVYYIENNELGMKKETFEKIVKLGHMLDMEEKSWEALKRLVTFAGKQ